MLLEQVGNTIDTLLFAVIASSQEAIAQYHKIGDKQEKGSEADFLLGKAAAYTHVVKQLCDAIDKLGRREHVMSKNRMSATHCGECGYPSLGGVCRHCNGLLPTTPL